MRNIEHAIAKKIITEALNRGWKIDVNDGEETVLRNGTTLKDIWAVMHTTEEEYLHFKDAQGNRLGWIWFIYGNGEDLISDHTDKPSICDLVYTTHEITAIR